MGNYRDNATPSDVVSGAFGVEVVALADSVGQGADQQCREVTIWPEASKSIKLGSSAVTAAAGVILPAGAITIPISNTNLLFFNGTTGDDVYIIWRS